MFKKRNLGNFLKASLFGLALGTVFFSGGEKGKFRGFKKSKKLRLNLEDSLAYASRKSEKEGIEDIREIIDSSDYEEAWINFPRENLWYEIGTNSEIRNKENSVSSIEIDLSDFKRAIRNSDSKKAIIYHNHPGYEEIHSIYDYTPSLYDLEWLNSLKKYEKTISESEKEISGRIVCVHGITDYDLHFKNSFENNSSKHNDSLYNKIGKSLKKGEKYSCNKEGISVAYREFGKNKKSGARGSKTETSKNE